MGTVQSQKGHRGSSGKKVTKLQEEILGKPKRTKGQFKTRVYSQQILKMVKEGLSLEEQELFSMLFEGIQQSHKLHMTEDLMLLDLAVMDYVRIKRLEKMMERVGETYELTLRSGQTVTKVHEVAYLANALKQQVRATLRDLQLTRKEKTKKQLGLGQQDFANFMSEDVIDVEST